MDFLGTEKVKKIPAGCFKCIRCGAINLIEEARKTLENDEKKEWNILSTTIARRGFNEVCAKMGMNAGDGLLYLISLYEKEALGKINPDMQVGVPGTVSK